MAGAFLHLQGQPCPWEILTSPESSENGNRVRAAFQHPQEEGKAPMIQVLVNDGSGRPLVLGNHVASSVDLCPAERLDKRISRRSMFRYARLI